MGEHGAAGHGARTARHRGRAAGLASGQLPCPLAISGILVNNMTMIPTQVIAAIRAADNEAYLSAVSVWEILVKHALGRLKMPAPASAYITRQRERHAIQPLALSEAAVAHLGRLPSHHRDPFDRML